MTRFLQGENVLPLFYVLLIYWETVKGYCKKKKKKNHLKTFVKAFSNCRDLNLGYWCLTIGMNKTAEWATVGWERKSRDVVRLAVCMMGKFFKFFMLIMHVCSTDVKLDFFI